MSVAEGEAIVNEAISYLAVTAINGLLAIAGLGLLLSACCCLICFGIDSDGERMRKWLGLALLFLSGAMLVMAIVTTVTAIYRVWFAI